MTLRPLTQRATVVTQYFRALIRSGLPREKDPIHDEAVMVLDGVGGFQFGPVLVRRAFAADGVPIAVRSFRWQFGVPGEIWTDLMWHRRNRVMAAQLARRLLALKRNYPDTRLHLLGISAGAGMATFALETLRGRPVVETLVMVCPGLSPVYPLATALSGVRRAYALVSERDRYVLGWGTRMFGTVDRRFESAAGCVGFRIPPGATTSESALYDRLREIRWTPDLLAEDHPGGHSGWVSAAFLRHHLIPILHGTPRLPVHVLSPSAGAGDSGRLPSKPASWAAAG